jgi:hypothetical protein
MIELEKQLTEAHAAIDELDKNPALLATASSVPNQLDKALAVAKAINATAAQVWR